MITIENVTIAILFVNIGVLWWRNRYLARQEFEARRDLIEARLSALAARRDLLAFKLDMGLNVEDDDNDNRDDHY